MTLRSSWISAAAFAVVFAAHARGWAEPETQGITLQEKLQIPGATLKAGEYTFSVEDRLRDRAVLRITEKGDDKHYLLLAAPHDKLGAAGQNGLMLFRSEAGKKQILKGWACPGCSISLEVVYPKAEAAKITAESGEPVLAVDPGYDKLPANLSPDDMKVVTLWLLTPQRIADNRGKGVTAAKYAGVAAETSSETQPRAAMTQPQPRMPKTASNTFSLGLWGLLLTLAGIGSVATPRRSFLRLQWKRISFTSVAGVFVGFAAAAGSKGALAMHQRVESR